MAKVNPIQVEKFLKGIDYPVSKPDLVKKAQDNGADQQVCETLKELPERDFDSPTDVSKAIGALEHQ